MCSQYNLDHRTNSGEDVDRGHFELPTRRRRCESHILTHPVMFDQSAKQYVVFRLASRAGVCEAQSRIESEERTGEDEREQ